MSCCSDVMNPIEASSCCKRHGGTTLRERYAIQAAAARRWFRTQTPLVGVVTERDVCCEPR